MSVLGTGHKCVHDCGSTDEGNLLANTPIIQKTLCTEMGLSSGVYSIDHMHITPSCIPIYRVSCCVHCIRYLHYPAAEI